MQQINYNKRTYMINAITNQDMQQDQFYMVVSDTIVIDRTLASCV